MTAVTTQTLTLTEFLLARLAEDEAAARAASRETMARPGAHRSDLYHWATYEVNDYDGGLTNVMFGSHAEAEAWRAKLGPRDEVTDEAAHIARHDPARVLADVEAKRRIVELEPPDYDRNRDNGPWVWSATVKALASVYADHPDYREEWRA